MADKRAYAKLDVGYLTNPKIAHLATISPTAVLLHIGSICYAAQHLTDGRVPVALLLRLTGATPEDAATLREFGLWECDGDDRHAQVHDYLEHQRSAAEAKRASDLASAAASARHSKAHAERNADRTADGNAIGVPREKEREIDPSVSLEPSTLAVVAPKGDDEKAPRRKPERPLPESWAPTARHREFALERGVDVDDAAESFRNHAATHDRRARDWNAAFRTWISKSKPTARTATPVPFTVWDYRPGASA